MSLAKLREAKKWAMLSKEERQVAGQEYAALATPEAQAEAVKGLGGKVIFALRQVANPGYVATPKAKAKAAAPAPTVACPTLAELLRDTPDTEIMDALATLSAEKLESLAEWATEAIGKAEARAKEQADKAAAEAMALALGISVEEAQEDLVKLRKGKGKGK